MVAPLLSVLHRNILCLFLLSTHVFVSPQPMNLKYIQQKGPHPTVTVPPTFQPSHTAEAGRYPSVTVETSGHPNPTAEAAYCPNVTAGAAYRPNASSGFLQMDPIPQATIVSVIIDLVRFLVNHCRANPPLRTTGWPVPEEREWKKELA